MSDRLGFLAGLLVMTVTSQAGAQDIRETRERLAAAVAALERARALEDSAMTDLDTVRVPPFVIATAPRAAEDVRSAARAAADSLRQIVGGALDLLDEVLVVAPPADSPTASMGRPWRYGAGGHRIHRADAASTARLARALVRPALMEFMARGGSPFFGWAGTFPSRTSITAFDLEQAYVELVTRPAWINRQCLQGDVRACGLALRVHIPDDPLLRLYDAQDRRRLVRAYRWPVEDSDVVGACQAREDDDACTTLLRSRDIGRQGTLSIPIRWTLLALALESGGRDAWHALIADSTAPVAERLARAGGQPLDSLLADWHRRVVAAANRPALGTAGARWSALVWFVIVLGLSLRSTRWRTA